MAGERRIDYRHTSAANINVEWTDGQSRTETAVAQLTDISRSGARLHLMQPIVMPATIKLQLNKAERVGQVRYCVKQSGGFAVGVRFLQSLVVDK